MNKTFGQINTLLLLIAMNFQSLSSSDNFVLKREGKMRKENLNENEQLNQCHPELDSGS